MMVCKISISLYPISPMGTLRLRMVNTRPQGHRDELAGLDSNPAVWPQSLALIYPAGCPAPGLPGQPPLVLVLGWVLPGRLTVGLAGHPRVLPMAPPVATAQPSVPGPLAAQGLRPWNTRWAVAGPHCWLMQGGGGWSSHRFFPAVPLSH